MDKFEPLMQEGMLLNGCVPITTEQKKIQRKLADHAVSLPEYSWREQGEMPFVKWDDAFEKWIDRRIDLYDKYAKAGLSLLPWDIFKQLPNKRKNSAIYAWNQGPIPSCSHHADAHSYQNSMLISIALGAPLRYEAINPIVGFWLANGKTLGRGQDLLTMSKWVNREGHYVASLIGDNNQSVPQGWENYREDCKKWQSGIVYLEDNLVEKIFRACHAGMCVTFGSGTIYNGASTNKDGIKVMSRTTFGGHAQSLGAYRKYKGVEYIFLFNSHGDIYGQSDEDEPANGAWITKDLLSGLTNSMTTYGLPYLTFIEGEITEKPKLYNEFEIKFNKNWKC